MIGCETLIVIEGGINGILPLFCSLPQEILFRFYKKSVIELNYFFWISSRLVCFCISNFELTWVHCDFPFKTTELFILESIASLT